MRNALDRTLSVSEQKAALREKIARMERKMTREDIAGSDALLTSALKALPEYERAGVVMLFSSFRHEPSMTGVLEDCLQRKKRVLLPHMLPGNELECREIRDLQQLVPGKFGILEPSPECPIIQPGEIDLMVVPAVCYDRHGGRLGRGAGYYDRLLAVYPGETVGLCREWFLQEEVPTQVHDIRVGIVVTEHGIYRQENRRQR